MIIFDAVFYFMTYLLIRFGYFPVDFLCFSKFNFKPSNSSLVFDDSSVTQTYCQQHLGRIFDYRFTFKEHLGAVFAKMHIGTVCSCHVTYAFESESTLYSCLNVKELLARSRREI